ncbi:MAG TPA: hypothetical protein VLH15_04570 [Dehalococcoidales bacterium]|nr:hypothetical protein [Dehalococcoidales bacterium]
MVKVLGIIFLLLLMTVSATACGSSGETSQATSSAPAAKTGTTAPATTTSKTTTTATSRTTTTTTGAETGSTGTANIGVAEKLPAKYPKDAFPVYEGSHILNVIWVENSYTVLAYSKSNYKDVIAFYENILKNAKVTAETKTDTSLTSFGTKDGYTYNIDVSSNNEYKGYQTSISIMLH